ncbi:hypothetical protein [Halomontanus rarus]|uniref:hypothetical protein n=1 Tax=Halomontanus rarus TaxID=3034020 RepID=UPI0023E850CF|nr:hypothetical protein [Halovivax sp. TS33]
MSPTGRVQSKEHDLNQHTLERVLELTDGENPVQYLDMDAPDTALGIISWIDDPKRIAGWRLANQEFCNPPLEIITDALDKQQRALEANTTLPVYHEPVHARASERGDDERESELPDEPTRGGGPGQQASEGTILDRTRTDEDDSQKPEQPVAEPATPSVHPRSRLNHGEVLVVDRGDRTEYITPTGPDADEPYHSRTVDDETEEVWNETGLSNSEVERRRSLEYERTEVDKLPDPTASHATGVTA